MDREKLPELHYLTPLDNVPSIAELGILSHALAQRVPHADISNQTMQGMRKDKRVAYAGQERPRKLHSYVNLFIHGRNSMQGDLCHRCGHETLGVLRVATTVLDLPGVVIADQNAASDYARFYASPAGLAYLEEQYVFARAWGSPYVDQIDYWRRKSRRSAEVLVPDRVEQRFIQGIYVSCDESAAACRRLAHKFPITIDADLFFQ